MKKVEKIDVKIETALLKTLQDREKYDKYISQVNLKKVLPNTKLLLEDYAKYFELYKQDTTIDFDKFYSHFSQFWHQNDEKFTLQDLEYYRDYVFPAVNSFVVDESEPVLKALEEKLYKEELETALLSGQSPDKLQDIINKYLEKANKEDDVDIHTVENCDFDVLDKSNGIPWFLPSLQAGLMSLSDGQFVIVAADFGTGKEQPLSANISTPTGWVKMGDIKLGDVVNSRKGVSKVIGIFPQGVKPVYKITFSDGRSCEAGLDHLFEVTDRKGKNKYHYGLDNTHKVISLREIIASEDELFVRLCAPVYKEHKELVIPPYSFGVLLGDGCLSSPGIIVSSNEEDIINKVAIELGLEYTKNKSNYSWTFLTKSTDRKYREYLINNKLDCTSSHKYIPGEYLNGSVEQRRDLLKGLMDTDGCVNKGNRFSFSTTSTRIKDGVLELARSLGYSCNYSVDNRKKYKGGICYTISIQTNDIIFSSKKHLERYSTNVAKGCNYRRYNDHIRIVSVEYQREEASQCIMIDDEEHLYITDNYVVTHNTAFVISQAVHAFKYLHKKGDMRPILYFNSEGLAGDVIGRFLSNLYKDKIQGGFEEIIERRKEVKDKFVKTFDASMFKCIQIANTPDFKSVKAKIEKYKPALVIIDICDKLAPDEDVQSLKKLYDGLRVLAGTGYPIIGTSQSGDTTFFNAEKKEVVKKKWLTDHDLYGSKTGKGGAADTIITIGKEEGGTIRYVAVVKKKRGSEVRITCDLIDKYSEYKEILY